jgi:hypothetical protein
MTEADVVAVAASAADQAAAVVGPRVLLFVLLLSSPS